MTKTELLAGGFIKVAQAAKRLEIDRNTLYRWMHEKKIPFLNMNGVYRIPKLAIDEMLMAGLDVGALRADE